MSRIIFFGTHVCQKMGLLTGMTGSCEWTINLTGMSGVSGFKERYIWRMNLKHLIILFIASSFLVSCGIEPQEQLNEAFQKADRVEMLMKHKGEFVTSIKFSYQNEEEMLQLKTGIGAFADNGRSCDDEMGVLYFWSEDEKVSEMSFNAAEYCKQLWIKDGLTNHYFVITDSLALMMNARFEMVRSIKSETGKSR
jgi:hypothetical protein